jgi:hypothetical protein
VHRRELKEELGRSKPKTITHLMEVANRWADGEDSMRGERDYTPEEDNVDARYSADPGRRSSRNSDRRRKRKNRAYDEAYGAELVAAQFASNRDNGGRTSGNREGSYRKQAREWQPCKSREDGQQAQTPA